VEISVEKRILATNDELAQANRKRFREADCRVLNLISSPGAGKTGLLERTVEALRWRDPPIPFAVIEGDIATEQDAARIRSRGAPAVQINTHGDCHLDARMVAEALDRLSRQLRLEDLDLIFIENVGNLVCPAEFDLGEDAKVVILSVAEGDDKPSKYPGIFGRAAALVVNKVDLLPYVDCNVQRLVADAREINPDLVVFEVSCRTGDGIGAWVEWLAALD
jgi:hydrogenase nickel incorporation protein HypB